MNEIRHIPKKELVAGCYYYGQCRNATIARWDGEKFIHWRTKFGEKFLEEIWAPEDEAIFDVFYAFEEATFSIPEIPLKRVYYE